MTLDVRTVAEFACGHIEHATNIDFRSDDFQDVLGNLDRNKTYLVYCASGIRSGSAFGMMTELDFIEAYNMLGGINQRRVEGLPTVE